MVPAVKSYPLIDYICILAYETAKQYTVYRIFMQIFPA